jgi:hypothetical protein
MGFGGYGWRQTELLQFSYSPLIPIVFSFRLPACRRRPPPHRKRKGPPIQPTDQPPWSTVQKDAHSNSPAATSDRARAIRRATARAPAGQSELQRWRTRDVFVEMPCHARSASGGAWRREALKLLGELRRQVRTG